MTALIPSDTTDPDELYTAFASWTSGQGLSLYPAQDEAILELVTGANVVLATPTGSGKSLVAVAAHYFALARGVRSVYTAPIKALVSEKFFALTDVFGAERVGMMTGDAAVNPDAPILCCTAEVLANIALRTGEASDLEVVILDEFHFYADPDRGWAWQVPLLELRRAQFLLMSATLGDTSTLAADLTRRTGRETSTVAAGERPVPLHHYYETTPLHETIADLLASDGAPIYVVHFTQAAALEHAQALTSINVASRAERDVIGETIAGFPFTAGFGKVLSRLVRHGIGVHHAGMLPKYRRLVEQLAQAGLLKVICGTDTLGVGINVPIRTVVFAALSKFDGERQRHLQVREFHQIAGRAGRAGFDTAGTVVVQAPEHEVENAKLVAKAGDDAKKLRRIVRKKPPEGFVSWGKTTHDRLLSSEPEALTARFAVTPAMVLNVIARPGDAFAAMRDLIRDNHTSAKEQREQVRAAIRAYRALLAAGVIERLDEPDADGRIVRLTADLPLNFALNQPLSTFALAALDLLDPDSEPGSDTVRPGRRLGLRGDARGPAPDRARSAEPRPGRGGGRAQGRGCRVRGADGVARRHHASEAAAGAARRRVRDLSADAPVAVRGRPASEVDRARHVGTRDDLHRVRLVLRVVAQRRTCAALSHRCLSRAALVRAGRRRHRGRHRHRRVAGRARPAGGLVAARRVGGARRRAPDQADATVEVRRPASLTENVRAFTVLVRNAMFRRVELFALRRLDQLTDLDPDVDWIEALEGYFAEYPRVGTGPDARNPRLLHVDAEEGTWHVRQVFDDPEGDHDWGITADIDLAASDEAGEPVVTVAGVGPLATV